jgi:Tfp pilus assembly protein PilO
LTAVIIIGCGGLSYWIYDQYQKTQQEEQNYQSQIATAKVKREKVPGLEREVIKLRENVKEYVKILPDTKEVNEFVKKLSDFANQSGVELVSLRDDKSRGGKRKQVSGVFDKESFRLELTANIFQFLKFISLIENYERFIKISDIDIKAGKYDEDILRTDVIHDFKILVETFIYNANQDGSGETNIQNYDKKRDMMIDEIKSARNEIKIERYEYVYDPSIRDPFIDPRSWISGEHSETGLDLKEQERFITDMADKLIEIKGLLEIVKESVGVPLIRRLEIQKEVAERIIELNNQINQSIEEKWITDAAFKRKLDFEILPELTKLNKNLDFAQNPTSVSMEELVFIRDELKTMYQSQDFDGCMKRYSLMRSQLGEQLKDLAVLNDEKSSVLIEIETLAAQAHNAKEFAGIELKISGIVSQNERSIVIVNGQVLKEGQRLQENLTVDRIGEKEVFFNYKGQIFKVCP